MTLKLATLFYSFLFACALLWIYLANTPISLWGSSPQSLAIYSFLGLSIALIIVALSRFLERFAIGRDLNRYFSQILGPINFIQAFTLALLSSIGEEVFFRYAMQPTFGLWATSLIFALLHLPNQRRLLIWTLMAFFLGLIMGALTLYSQSILPAIIMHFIVNLLNIYNLKNYRISPNLDDKSDPNEMEEAPSLKR